MSTISSQIDALRKAAQNYRDLGKYEAEQMFLDVVDAIQRLRDDLQRVNAENAKLRNEVDNLRDFEHLTSVAVAYAGCDECGEYKQTMLRLFAENAKLRETLKVLMMGTNAELCADRDEADCTMCSMHHGKDGCTMVDAMELLGIDIYGMPLGVVVKVDE